MLTTAYLRENKELVLDGLAKRNFQDAEKVVDSVLEKDSLRRAAQAELDQILAESNKISKEIGNLFK